MTETNKPTDAKQPNDETKAATPEPPPAKDKVVKKPKVVAPKPEAAKKSDNQSKNGLSVLALFLSIIAIAGIGGHYYWQTQQHQLLLDKVAAQNANSSKQSEQQILSSINQQQNLFAEQLNQQLSEQLNRQTSELAELRKQLKQLNQGQSENWLLKEAEYLVQIAARSLWLEKQPQTTIALLLEADSRLESAKDATLLPLRESIRADIEALKLLPKLDIDHILLSLMALNKQVSSLPIAMAYMPDTDQTTQDLTLSDSTDDWQENLAKTWQKFLDSFITVKRRTANVEALLSPKQQQNLRTNLALKLELAQWAVTQQQREVYQQSLQDALLWINEYFDTDTHAVQVFVSELQQLANSQTRLELPKQLSSLALIKEYLQSNQTLPSASNEQPEGESL